MGSRPRLVAPWIWLFPDISLTVTPGSGDANRSGIAFNPVFQVYYSVDAGSVTFPMDAFDTDGNFLANGEQGFDYRGLWYNEIASTVEGNGFSTLGIFIQNLNASTGLPTGVGATVLPGNQPSSQSCGDIDPEAYQLVYYDAGAIFRYNRTNNNFVDSFSVSGLPVEISAINSTSIVYTGCAGKEYGLWDFVNRRILYVDKATGAYSGFTQLPVTAPERDRFAMSYANGRLWLYDTDLTRWLSYFITDATTATPALERLSIELSFYPNPTQDVLNLKLDGTTDELLTAEVYQVSGQLMIAKKLSGTTNLDVSTLVAGTYFIRLVGTQTGKITLTKAFVKE